MTDGKEWVSIKIPESIRDPARDDPRTYGQIMQDGLGAGVTVPCGCGEYSVMVPKEEETPDIDVVCPVCDNHFGQGTTHLKSAEAGDGIDAERIESSLATIEERTGKLERMLEGLQG